MIKCDYICEILKSQWQTGSTPPINLIYSFHCFEKIPQGYPMFLQLYHSLILVLLCWIRKTDVAVAYRLDWSGEI